MKKKKKKEKKKKKKKKEKTKTTIPRGDLRCLEEFSRTTSDFMRSKMRSATRQEATGGPTGPSGTI